MQTDVAIDGQYITGTLKYLDTGAIPAVWGPGYFMALQFDDIPEDAIVKVGMSPSASGMPLIELDEDKNGVFKVTDKNTQTFKVMTVRGADRKTDTYYLSTLVFEDTDA